MRKRRVALFEQLVADLPEPVRVLDVGGSPSFWAEYRARGDRRLRITLLNNDPKLAGLPDALALRLGDARDLGEFPDDSFDACFSNSLIEHVGTFYDQQRVAREIRRIAPRYFVQTPNRHFVLEPHFLLPGFHYLPTAVRAALHRRWRLGWMPAQPDPVLARAEAEQIRLLSYDELSRLFPDARVVRETIGPATKSLIALRGPRLDAICPLGDRL